MIRSIGDPSEPRGERCSVERPGKIELLRLWSDSVCLSRTGCTISICSSVMVLKVEIYGDELAEAEAAADTDNSIEPGNTGWIPGPKTRAPAMIVMIMVLVARII